ncbi:YqiA/YcfP family alpha/beta fold hydrolase [Helicobacter sp. 13S00477-4]|uniref:YqiA/YcfP family alpha/beta fold hydrolase n=1 Tax=Helicobacter sp. 13S00477-4 TaxID=1905759 RepID=UPI000BA78F92|nr:YqiA/YcfP family alpha/beta fold hydrolase [Helicobacter sp. 13S00477-4]PAF52331.1 hypothetical protein BKH44_03220 [Helicobacter sp. 13S00477-4]
MKFHQIFYLHRFNSSKGSLSVQRLVEQVGINVCQLDYESYAKYDDNFQSLCLETKENLMQDKSLMFIGNSLGGFYVGMLALYFSSPVILINPVIEPLKDLQRVLKKTHEPSLYDFSLEVVASYLKKLEISKSKY